MTNLPLLTDSYKAAHHLMYPKGTEIIHSYFEARKGALYDKTLFFGLQYYIKKYLEGSVVTQEHIEEARSVIGSHMGKNFPFNENMWQHIVDKHEGRLPLYIKAVPEGSVVDIDNVLMTVVNTDPLCAPLVGHFETLLTQIWYPSTVATRSHFIKKMLSEFFQKTADSDDALNFALHDFGFRGVSSLESAGLGGAAHLISFRGTDTIAGLITARDYYQGDLTNLGFSVPASEHSVMCSGDEKEIVERVLNQYPTGIVSIVADTYDIYNFVKEFICKDLKQKILNRDGKVVIRPDSPRYKGDTPEDQVLWLLNILWEEFGGTINSKGYKVLNPSIGIIYGDGLSVENIKNIYSLITSRQFSAENVVVGQGGGLLQKVNRDTQRFAFKASAICINGIWKNISKKPLDRSKKSKEGFMALKKDEKGYKTIQRAVPYSDAGLLKPVFSKGRLLSFSDFESIRCRSEV